VTTELDGDIREFIDTLGKQNRALISLVQLEEEKRRIIILGQVDELNKLNQKEGILVSNLQKLEVARFRIHAKLARLWETSVQELPIGQMLAKVKDLCPEWVGEMQTEVKQLKGSLARLQSANKENNDLINQSLEYINIVQSILTGDVAGTYSDMGIQVDESTARPIMRLLDKKI